MWLYLVWANSSKAKKNNHRKQNILEGKQKMPEYYLICPNIFGHFPNLAKLKVFLEKNIHNLVICSNLSK